MSKASPYRSLMLSHDINGLNRGLAAYYTSESDIEISSEIEDDVKSDSSVGSESENAYDSYPDSEPESTSCSFEQIINDAVYSDVIKNGLYSNVGSESDDFAGSESSVELDSEDIIEMGVGNPTLLSDRTEIFKQKGHKGADDEKGARSMQGDMQPSKGPKLNDDSDSVMIPSLKSSNTVPNTAGEYGYKHTINLISLGVHEANATDSQNGAKSSYNTKSIPAYKKECFSSSITNHEHSKQDATNQDLIDVNSSMEVVGDFSHFNESDSQ